ncbi:uncharacterized protein LOC128755614 [Synchiropus splendidus]|uniref:uncharacterized protein LOC128755614 n=1 Tax=Synchiropus splendidus TaxID=270530 RepID=UPI00237EAC81|nr:uncharacterized protein LOC128755614 [Synchiropus splendidus]XP_053715355.1 uncharacterized protein LOC128755614 [Synchiropus splendidus]
MNMFRREKSSTPTVPPRPSKEDLDNPITHSLQEQKAEVKSSDVTTTEVISKPKRTGVMGVMQKVNPFKSTSQTSTITAAPTSESQVQMEPSDTTQNPGMFRGVMQKVNPFRTHTQIREADSTESLEQEKTTETKQNPGMLKGVMNKVNPFKSSAQVPKNAQDNPVEREEGLEEAEGKQRPGMIAGVMNKVNPFKSSQPKDTRSLRSDLSSSEGSLAENNNLPEKQNPGMLKGMMQKVNPFRSSAQVSAGECQTDSAPSMSVSSTQESLSVHSGHSSSAESLEDGKIERHTVWYIDTESEEAKPLKQAPPKRTMTFRIKRILPSALFGAGTKSATENAKVQQETVEVQTLEFAEVPVPSEGAVLDPLDDEDGLLSWWRTVEGWEEWNEANQNEDTEDVVEEAADRVFMAARLFVRLFNQRGASLQQRILELLSLADAADCFHKKTVTASVGGGVASVAGSVTTITGLILAPFTAGTSLIVTAVGIGVATAGGLASASANITDTVHSKTDRKKVEKMIQDYQEEIMDIKNCLEFLQEGMETLEEWNFEKYAESIAKKHLNQNVKHVMKEGGRAGKALVINTESLISTVQVLSVAGGAAKAAQVMSVTTGVMSGLFLALDIFFLAKDSVELKKGAKTEFATKIREVCKDLQDGLLELNRIKEQLQKTMDGIEVEVEEEEVDEEQLKSDLKKLIELEEE